MSIAKHLAAWSALTLLTISATAEAAKPLTILYIPLDNRPVNAAYVEQTMHAAGCKVVMPQEKLLPSNIANANPDTLWDWLLQKAPKADAAVISTDSLIYGGLVASRTHNIPLATLQKRVERLNDLERALPINMYAFSTIMRTPRASKGRVEPPYYDKFGPKIFAYSEWMDKEDQHRLPLAEQFEKAFARHDIPEAYLEDWLQRRKKNYEINVELINLAKRNKFHFFAIGKDDNAILSSTHMEARHLSREAFAFSKKDFSIIDGVDQLGLLLMTRAFNEANNLTPQIYPLYSEGVGQGTLPQYSDARFQDSVPQQIIASGAAVATNINTADFILAINSPEDGVVQDATAFSNKYFASPANKRFIDQLIALERSGKKISLADVSYSNGGDNGFMHIFALAGGLPKLIAYNGWNTDDNTIGYAIAQGTMAAYTQPKDLTKLIKQRIIDDWFYQSNARNKQTEKFEKITREDLKYNLGALNKITVQEAKDTCTRLCNSYAFTKDTNYTLSFPWDRLFEVEIKIKK